MAEIHRQLRQDCIVLGKLSLCHLLLMNDASYPWFILVPDREDITEIYQLAKVDQQRLLTESSQLGQFLVEQFRADKLNIAALGNMVPQLHIHHIVRYETDATWPKPVWGQQTALPYTDEKISEIKALLFQQFDLIN